MSNGPQKSARAGVRRLVTIAALVVGVVLAGSGVAVADSAPATHGTTSVGNDWKW